jgi:hypothetical protein
MLLKILENFETVIEHIKRPVYITTAFSLQLIYVLIFFKVIDYTPTIVHYLNEFIQVFVAVFLIIKFNPFKKHELKEFDSTIILGSAFMLLSNVGFTAFITSSFEKTTNNIESKL